MGWSRGFSPVVYPENGCSCDLCVYDTYAPRDYLLPNPLGATLWYRSHRHLDHCFWSSYGYGV